MVQIDGIVPVVPTLFDNCGHIDEEDYADWLTSV